MARVRPEAGSGRVRAWKADPSNWLRSLRAHMWRRCSLSHLRAGSSRLLLRCSDCVAASVVAHPSKARRAFSESATRLLCLYAEYYPERGVECSSPTPGFTKRRHVKRISGWGRGNGTWGGRAGTRESCHLPSLLWNLALESTPLYSHGRVGVFASF